MIKISGSLLAGTILTSNIDVFARFMVKIGFMLGKFCLLSWIDGIVSGTFSPFV